VIDAFNAFEASRLNQARYNALGATQQIVVTQQILVTQQIVEFWKIFDSAVGPTKDDLTLQASRPELTAEAVSCLIFSLSRSFARVKELQGPLPSATLLDKACQILLLCLSRSDDISIKSSSEAISQLWPLLPSQKQDEIVQGWFSHIRAGWNLPTGRGYISVLGSIFSKLPLDDIVRQSIIEELIRCAEKEDLIEKRVAAVKSLTTGILPHIGMQILWNAV
jgi:hypothetical protein